MWYLKNDIMVIPNVQKYRGEVFVIIRIEHKMNVREFIMTKYELMAIVIYSSGNINMIARYDIQHG